MKSSDSYVLPWVTSAAVYTNAYSIIFNNRGTSSSKFKIVRSHCSFALTSSIATNPVLLKDVGINFFQGFGFNNAPFKLSDPLLETGGYNFVLHPVGMPTQECNFILSGGTSFRLLVGIVDTTPPANYDGFQSNGYVEIVELTN